MDISVLNRFADILKAQFSLQGAASPEDQLKAPVRELLREAGGAFGLAVRSQTEAHLPEHKVWPDIGVYVSTLICGYIELKAPGLGADAPKLKSPHNKRQWKRLQALPNLIYTDGREWALYRSGERSGGRVEGRRVTSRESVAHPALSHRAAVRVPWARFLPPRSPVGSRTGAPPVGSGGCSVAFAPGLSPAPVGTFPAPAASNPAGPLSGTGLSCWLRPKVYVTVRAGSAFGRSPRLLHLFRPNPSRLVSLPLEIKSPSQVLHRWTSLSSRPCLPCCRRPASSRAPSLHGNYPASTLSGRRRRAPRALASVRRSNGTCGFPAYRFHEDVFA